MKGNVTSTIVVLRPRGDILAMFPAEQSAVRMAAMVTWRPSTAF